MNDFHADESREYEELWEAAEAKVEKLEDKIERLTADKGRLDWMETQHFVEATRTSDKDEEERPGLIWLIHTGKSLRSAIDEAIARARGKEARDE